MTHLMSTIANQSGVPNWLEWIANDDGNDTIDADADGVFTQDNKILIDLSHALSIRLGRQMSMMSTYKVNYIRIELLNKDDANDNDSGLCVSGVGHYYSPTKHRINALQLARQVEQASESVQVDGDSFLLSTDKDYQGLRFNWDADGQVHHATSEAFSNLSGNEWDLNELFDVYGDMQGDLDYGNSLWSSRTGYPNNFGFAVSFTNDLANFDVTEPTNLNPPNIHDPKSLAFELQPSKPLEVLGGLMMLNITHSSGDSPINSVDDDYLVRVTVGVEGWSDF